MPSVRDHPRLSHLALNERDAPDELLARLQPRCGDRVVCIWLFGSKACGDFDDESDVDLLIVIRDADDVLREEVSNVAYDLSLSPLLRHRVYYDGRVLYCIDDAVRVRFETTALRDYVDTEPLRRIKHRYVLQYFRPEPRPGRS
jgi:predicted nucleotidyltransferase